MKSILARSAAKFSIPVLSPFISKFRFILAYLILAGVALALGIAAIWFIVPSTPVDPLLHSKSGIPATMFMTGKVTLLTDDGTPASNAVAVLNNEQQAQADVNGVVYFSDVMLHDHNLSVAYKGEHYNLAWHVHNAESNVLLLGMSVEFRRTIGYILSGLFFGWLFFVLVVLSKLSALGHFRLAETVLARRPKFTKPAFVSMFKSRRSFALVGFFVLSVMAASLSLTLLTSPNSMAQAAGDVVATLAVPSNLKVEQDDNNAILSWGDPVGPSYSDPPNVTGYKISWGLAGSSAAPTVQLTAERMIQLQPLVNGQTYQAQVQSVDGSGNLSAPSQAITFTGDPSRVNALRSRMTGFFDDFNRPAGPFDELKWNQAFSACNDPAMSSSFINAQFHAHDMELSSNCDRAQVVNRPRATFDFTGRTGTVAFDLDGLTSRSMWYLDLIDIASGVTDIDSHISETGTGAGNPGNVLRIRQNDEGLSFQYATADGNISTIADTNWNPYPPLDWAGFKTIPNMRRHWELHISQQKIEVTINGTVVLSTAYNLPFSKATVHWTAFSYNTAKHNVPYALVHWDNFGFDGPAPAVETHNYRADGYAGRDFLTAANNSPSNLQINIPDSVAGATAQRLMFTLQLNDYSTYQWKSTDKVIINGVTVAVPQPKVPSGMTDSGVSNIEPYSMSLNLPAGTLQTGLNQLSFVMNYSKLLNIHLELDFPKGSAPAYTQPSAIYPTQSSQVTIPMPEVGPAVTIDSLDNTATTNDGRYTTNVFNIAGTVQVNATVTQELAMDAMGKNPGISKIQLRLNKTPIYELNLGTLGAPASNVAYKFDTTAYPNGRYELDIVAYNPSGAVSIPNYFEAAAKAGDYYPIEINISNTGSVLQTTPATTTAAAPTTTAAPTATTKPATTAAPTATAKPTTTAVPTATAKPTATPQPTVTPPPPTPVTPTSWVMNSVVKVSTTSGGKTSIVSRFTAPTKVSGSFILDVEVYDLATNAKVAQWSPTKSVTAEQTVSLTNSVTLKPGNYVVKQGVFKTNWTFVAWQDGTAFQVK